ncbi:MAG: hypothetical protein E8D46_02455 [Nitrospira sp.]|nr:MAG: hypothetical protein E8D46_02455 [Nitrospira sp.]
MRRVDTILDTLIRRSSPQAFRKQGSKKLDLSIRENRDGWRWSRQYSLKASFLILNSHAFQYLGKKGRIKVDRMAGLDRLVRYRLKRYDSALILEENLAGLASAASRTQ